MALPYKNVFYVYLTRLGGDKKFLEVPHSQIYKALHICRAIK